MFFFFTTSYNYEQVTIVKRVELETSMFVVYWWRCPGIEGPKISGCSYTI